MKKMYNSGTKDVKIVFRRFREQSQSERKSLIAEHENRLREFVERTRLFLEKLPKSRIPDYYELRKNRRKAKPGEVNVNKKVKFG